jgi:hypothetical protein
MDRRGRHGRLVFADIASSLSTRHPYGFDQSERVVGGLVCLPRLSDHFESDAAHPTSGGLQGSVGVAICHI